MSGIGMPAALLLNEFGEIVSAAFNGEIPYHVGSSLSDGLEGARRDWRDVDVRLILSDEEYEAQGFGHPDHTHSNAKWRALVLAFSALGKQMTGLPIDFQIQQQTQANAKYPGPRSALFTVNAEPSR